MIKRTNADFELNGQFLFANLRVDNGNTVERHKEEIVALSPGHKLEKKEIGKHPVWLRVKPFVAMSRCIWKFKKKYNCYLFA